MANTLAQLAVNLKLNQAEFQAGMNQANKSMKRMRTNTKKMSGSLKSGTAQMLRFAKAGIAVAGLSFSTSFLKGIIETTSQLAKTADAVGINVESFQAYQHAAQDAGISTGQFTSNMQAFVKRIGEARNQGTGPLVTSLKTMDAALLDSLKNAKSQNDAFLILADAMENAADASERAALANAAFGRSGVAMTGFLRGGREGLNKMEAEARRLGLVIGEDLVRASERYDSQLLTLSNRMKSTFGKAFLTVVKGTMDNANLYFFSWVSAVNQGANQLNSMFFSIASVLEGAVTIVVKGILEGVRAILGWVGKLIPSLATLAEKIPKIGSVSKQLADRQKAINEQLKESNDAWDDYVQGIANADLKTQNLRDGLAKASKPLEKFTITQRQLNDSLEGDGLTKQLTLVEQYAARLKSMQADADAYGGKIAELNRQHKAGEIGTKLFKRELEDLKKKFGAGIDAVDDLGKDATKLSEALDGIGERGLGGFVDTILDAKASFSDFARSFIKEITAMILKIQILNSFKSIPGLGGLFGGAKMAGGPVAPGKTYLVGERGPELFSPGQAGNITPNKSLATVVNVYNNTVSEVAVSESKTAQGGKSIAIMIEDAVKQSFVRGGHDRVLRNIYGMKRRGI